LATKVSFANEIHQICQKLNVDYDKVIEYATKDKRLGTSHWAVPGPDGKVGFGLTCFPKDLNALINVALGLGLNPRIMKAVWEKNLEIRPEKDWEKLKGRTIL
jgi:UDPglucose 6-dehydrogenase